MVGSHPYRDMTFLEIAFVEIFVSWIVSAVEDVSQVLARHGVEHLDLSIQDLLLSLHVVRLEPERKPISNAVTLSNLIVKFKLLHTTASNREPTSLKRVLIDTSILVDSIFNY